MNEVVQLPQTIHQPPSETMALVHMIERAARDPSVDIDKLTKLLELRTKIEEQNAKRAFANAMTEAQTAIRPVAADANNPQTKSKYASYAALDRAVRPIYSKSGFSLSFNTTRTEPDFVKVLCEVTHDGGYSRHYEIDMPADGKGAKGGDVMTKTHATGSAVTYGQRYLLKMIFNVAVGDDDGNAGSGSVSDHVSPEQVAELRKALTETGGNEKLFCNFAKVEELGDIFANRFDAAMAKIRQAGTARAEQKAKS